MRLVCGLEKELVDEEKGSPENGKIPAFGTYGKSPRLAGTVPLHYPAQWTILLPLSSLVVYGKAKSISAVHLAYCSSGQWSETEYRWVGIRHKGGDGIPQSNQGSKVALDKQSCETDCFEHIADDDDNKD